MSTRARVGTGASMGERVLCQIEAVRRSAIEPRLGRLTLSMMRPLGANDFFVVAVADWYVDQIAETGSDDEVDLPHFVVQSLSEVGVDLLPEGLPLEVVVRNPSKTYPTVYVSGHFERQGSTLVAEIEEFESRKYWRSVLPIDAYYDGLRRGISMRPDIALVNDENQDDVFYTLRYRWDTGATDLQSAAEAVEMLRADLQSPLDVVERALAAAYVRAREQAFRLAPLALPAMIERVEEASDPAEKGRALEDLLFRLLSSVDGFEVIPNVRTETEEIDVAVINHLVQRPWSTEGSLILFECKNWTSRCGKNEIVLFKEKIRNRHERASLGFLLSWNGFAETVDKELLRDPSTPSLWRR